MEVWGIQEQECEWDSIVSVTWELQEKICWVAVQSLVEEVVNDSEDQ